MEPEFGDPGLFHVKKHKNKNAADWQQYIEDPDPVKASKYKKIVRNLTPGVIITRGQKSNSGCQKLISGSGISQSH